MLDLYEIKEKIRNFIYSYVGKAEFGDTDEIFKLGIVNSLFAIQLIHFMENNFHISIETDDLDLENFKSIETMGEFVTKKTKPKECNEDD